MSGFPDSTTIKIQLTQSYVTVIDAIDADLAEFKWCARVARSGKVYAVREIRTGNGKRTSQSLHRVILARMLGRELERNEDTDHIEHSETLDNRRSNLRLATRSQNGANAPAYRNNRSGYKGVSWHKQRKKWHAAIKVNRKSIYLGYFDDPAEAHAAYCAAAERYFGEFANGGKKRKKNDGFDRHSPDNSRRAT